MKSSISLLVRIWKTRHSSPGCSFVWILRVVYFLVKHSCLYNNMHYHQISFILSLFKFFITVSVARILSVYKKNSCFVTLATQATEPSSTALFKLVSNFSPTISNHAYQRIAPSQGIQFVSLLQFQKTHTSKKLSESGKGLCIQR